ncbi:MAG: pilus assembly protein TadG-related protein [Gammaproteobacteria bacterium]
MTSKDRYDRTIDCSAHRFATCSRFAVDTAIVRIPALPGRQSGAAALMFVIGMVAIVATAGLALDGGHVFLEKAQLQTAVDGAALGGAKAIDETPGDLNRARNAASAVFGRTATGPGNDELGSAWNSGGINLNIQFSRTLNPFVPGSLDGPYVRAIATGYTLPAWLTPIIGINQFVIRSSAVAGPSPGIGDQVNENLCDFAPLTICEDPTGPGPIFGYSKGDPLVLKSSQWQVGGPIGPGNFQALRIGGNGANVYRKNMAGGVEGLCLDAGDTPTVETEPGNMVGPTAMGLNTRFGQYKGGGMNRADYPPDVITRQGNPELTVCNDKAAPGDPDYRQICPTGSNTFVTRDNLNTHAYTHANYEAHRAANNFNNPPGPNGGVFERRILTLPVTDCSGRNNGQSTLPVVGFVCFYLLQDVQQKGKDSYIFGQLIDGCGGTGVPGSTPGPGNSSAYIIQLYDDPSSTDS